MRYTFLSLVVVLTLLGGAAAAAAPPTEPDNSSAIVAVTEDTVGLVDPAAGEWRLRHDSGGVASFFYGNPDDVPFMGDWDCDGITTPGLFRTSDAFAYLRDTNRQGVADIRFFFGNPSDVPLAGDFNGDDCDTLSIYRPSEQRFYIVNELGENDGGLGAADFSFVFGNPGDKPVVGDWDGDGIDEVGLHRESTGFFYWRNTLDTGVADGEIFFGDPGDRFVAGDWGVVDGKDTPGLFRPSDVTFYFRHTLTQGVADSQFTWTGADSDWLPVAGTFSNVEITINTVVPGDGRAFGPFTATGAAVDEGLICPRGETEDSGTTGTPIPGGTVFRTNKLFVCKDGSGTFTLRLEATVISQPFSDVGTWVVSGGTGKYVKLEGAGSLVGSPTDTGVLDIFTGTVDITN